MSRYVSFIFCLLLVGALLSSFIVAGAASEWSTKVDIPTFGSVTRIYDGANDEWVTYTPAMQKLNIDSHTALYEYGLRNMFSVTSVFLPYFVDGRGQIWAENFSSFYSSDEYGNLRSVDISNYKYYTFSVICGINYGDNFSIDSASLNTGLTAAGFISGSLDCTFTDIIQNNTTSLRCYTFGLSTRDIGIPAEVVGTVGSLLNSIELYFAPNISTTTRFNIVLSDISLRLYSSDDVVSNQIGSLEDAINKSNQEVVSKLDELENTINQGNQDIVDKLDKVEDAIIQGDVSVDNSDLNGINGAVGDLDDIEGAVTDATPEWDPSILTGVPDDLTGTLSFIGGKLMLIVDGPFGTVIFFCLTMGLCLTLIGRAVR